MSPRRLSPRSLVMSLLGAIALSSMACGEDGGEDDSNPADGSAGVSLLSNDAGQLTERGSVELAATRVSTAQLDGDNMAEVLAAGESTSLLRWRANAFAAYQELEDVGSRIVAGGNVLDSNRPDVVALRSSGLTVVPVDEAGDFDESLRVDVATEACWMALMDFDEDNDFDIVTAGTQLQLHEASPAGLAPPVVMAEVDGACEPQRFAVVDVNTDGLPDVVYGVEQRINLVLNRRTLWATDQFSVESTVEALVAGDFDGDFDDDLLISDGSSLELLVRIQGVLFESAQRHEVPHGPLHAFDLQGDDTLDVLTVGGGAVIVYSGLGSDSLQTLAELPLPQAQATIDLTSGDVDGDGDEDVILTNDTFDPGN